MKFRKLTCLGFLGLEIYLRVTPGRFGRPKLKRLPQRSLYRLHIGPGPGWRKPDDSWITVDTDPARGDIVTDFNTDFAGFPLPDHSVACIYASHVFEHISIYAIRKVMAECYRILRPGGILRIIVPDPVTSMQHYLAGNNGFRLFERRIARAAKRGEVLTLFGALREDFISPSNQKGLLGSHALAHQNAWDFEAMQSDLVGAGFRREQVVRSMFQKIGSSDFAFEGTYPSEANEHYRSLYIEAAK